MIKVAIITVSDKGSRGERIDTSGPGIEKALNNKIYSVGNIIIIPDEKKLIIKELKNFIKNNFDLIFTTGGTGLGPRDVTPEATFEVIEKPLPGFSEAMRIQNLKNTPFSIISRGICGIAKKTLIINLPGSPKAVKECLEVILPAIPHAVYSIKGEVAECANKSPVAKSPGHK
ncbi:MAG: MogA/MoaB family molybdenum cofactor biosynthesis protein [bacterium]|nr:MogA/MoaB family molybdenum cofactor biosynthesis protein [bacterium]